MYKRMKGGESDARRRTTRSRGGIENRPPPESNEGGAPARAHGGGVGVD